MEQHRNVVFDAIKALAIMLVVYAHSIQYLSGVDYWNNGVFQFIYSFHMPLFFVIKHVPKWISVVGVSTAAIYILQSLLLEYLMGKYLVLLNCIYQLPQWAMFSIYLPCVTIIVVVLCLLLCKLIQKNAYISMFLIGDTRILVAKNA